MVIRIPNDWFVENTEVIVENNSLENITSECKMSKLT